MNRKLIVLLSAGGLLLAGCGAPRVQHPPQVEARYTNPVMERVMAKPEEGSLWTEAVEVSLYSELRAKRVGEIVTVRIVEDPEAELNASTNTSRSSSIQARMEVLGLVKKLSERFKTLPADPLTENLIDASLGSKHDGKGSSARDGHVKAYVTCVVEKVFPNGYLFIRGKREIWVNNEKQYIMLSGTVRPEDINAQNEIASTYVADVEIVYAGVGPVADKQKPGWLGRIVDHVWPF